MLYTGQRRSDAVRMGWQHITGNKIKVRRIKTDVFLQIPVHPTLRAVLAKTPRDNLRFLTTAYGKPFTAAGFGNWFREQRDAAGLPQCSAHGLRKAAARRLAEAGGTNQQIKRSPITRQTKRSPATRPRPTSHGSRSRLRLSSRERSVNITDQKG
jgi:integrase